MDMSALASDMLKWEKMRRELDLLEEAIKDAVLQIGKTQTVGNVRATYSAGRKTYDYEGAVRGARIPEDEWTVKKTVDWKATCDLALIAPGSFTQSPPSVTVKLLE